MRSRLYTLLMLIVAGPPVLYVLGWWLSWFQFRPEAYAMVVCTSFGAGFMAAGIHAVSTKQMPVRGGGTITGVKAVQSGWVCLVIGSFVMITGIVGLIVGIFIPK